MCVNSEMDFPGSTAFNGEHRRSLSQRIFPSYACAFLDDDPAYECCSANPVAGSLSTCRRSPRLLSNGYYVLTEDSFLSDEEGNVTLTPSQTSVTYKENLVRVFRRRKKIRRSLASLFNLDASSSWLSSTVLSNMDSSHVDDPWPDGYNKPEATQSDTGDSDFSSEYNSYVPQRQTPAPNGASLIKDDEVLQPEKPSCASKSCSPFMINANEETWSNAESRIVRNILSQMVALITCLITSICTRIQEFNVSQGQQDNPADLLAFELTILEVRKSKAQLGEPYCNEVSDFEHARVLAHHTTSDTQGWK